MENDEMMKIIDKMSDEIENLKKGGKEVINSAVAGVKKEIDQDDEEAVKLAKEEAEKISKKLKLKWLV